MQHYQYLIIGGGMTASAALGGIRQADGQGTIGVIGAESDPPYSRPPLSKGLWKGKPFEKVWLNVDDYRADLHLGRMAVALDTVSRRVTDDRGEVYSYGKLLLATGGTPRHLPYDQGGINYYRYLDDYRELRKKAAQRRHFVVIGGGFIGSEVAAALTMNDQQVSMVFPERGIGERVYPAEISAFITDYYRQKGIEVLAGEMPVSMDRNDGRYTLRTQSGVEVAADGVVAGIGIQPNIALAEAAGLKVDNGIVVDEFLRASNGSIDVAGDVFAAGDVANFYNPLLGKRLRVEHEDNAYKMGELAGYNMAAEQPKPYDYLPYFYSDLFELGYEAVGELDSRLETFADWQEPFKTGVIYYLDAGRVRGVLLWNVWEQVDAARKLIGEPGPLRGEDLKGRIR